ncbi:class III lanthionine synthetase LanKC [Lactiplantibacillus plantarum]|uniref:class III lanthionine synthetase LanKC n=1 Tax=Lactiplantibacillus plantarum TaxID=1590 RepID=UPI0007BC32A9|nr:class III lanthionine synthetase LanKC [Lactiplantibacillus plantarum]KZU84946.1 Lanthionine biosynthesis protein LanL [Lactiplantibacillus plantarum]
MSLNYEEFLAPKSKFYKKNNGNRAETKFKIFTVPTQWKHFLDKSNYWDMYIPNGSKLPPQGWKIHISTKLDEAQRTLNIVTKVLFDMGISFKFVNSRWDLFRSYSKYGNRVSAGKFITIYPATEYIFKTVLDKLKSVLHDLPEGPFILSDKRYQETNIYYRYGGFVEMRTEEGKLAILDDKNKLIPDLRVPYFVLPDFVKVPDFLQEDDEGATKDTPLKRFKIEGPVHFSNGGGVYLAVDNASQRRVILKEGRPNIGLDTHNRSGLYRVIKEAKLLKKLKNHTGIIDYIEDFQAWKHHFLVEEYYSGQTLHSWVSENYPFTADRDSNTQKEYVELVMNIINALKHIVDDVHGVGISIGDLSLTNVLINDKSRVKIIDFEAGGRVNDSYVPDLQTPGFYSNLVETKGQADDFALMRIVQFLFYPSAQIQDIKFENEVKIDNWIFQQFGDYVQSVVSEFEERVYSQVNKLENLKSCVDKKKTRELSVDSAINGLRNGLLSTVKVNSPYLIPGDIRQTETKGGLFNVLTGGYGGVLALLRTGAVPSYVIEWVECNSSVEKLNKIPVGLFSGIAGIAGVLYSLGYKEKARRLLDKINIANIKDISLYSGLSGIGLSFLLFAKNPVYKDKLIRIGKRLEELYFKNIEIKSIDPEFVDGGLIDGWSGAAVYLIALFRETGETRWSKLACTIMRSEIDKLRSGDGTLLLEDKNKRLMPYIGGGSTGVALAIALLRDSGTDEMFNLLKNLGTITQYNCSYNAGLFRGYSSFIEANTLFSMKSCSKFGIRDDIDKLMNTLNVFLINYKSGIFIPGEYGLRLSEDLFSGASGVILALNGYQTKRVFSWLPLPVSILDKYLYV